MGKLPWRSALLGALAVAGAAARVQAIDAETLLLYNWGDFTLKPQLNVATIATDNVFYGNDAPEYARFNRPREGDLISFISPGLSLQYGQPLLNFITLEYFHDNYLYAGLGAPLKVTAGDITRDIPLSAYNYSQNRISLKPQFNLGRTTITGSDSIEFLDGIMSGGVSIGPIPIQRTVYLDNYRVGYDYSDKSDFYALINHATYNYAEHTPFYDQTSVSGSLGATYRLTPLVGLFTELYYGRTFTSPNQPLSPNFPNVPHSSVYGGFIGGRGDFTPRLSGTVKIGVEHRAYAEGGPSDTAPAFDVALTYAATPKRAFQLSFQRRTGVSLQLAEQSYVYDNFFLSVSQFIGRGELWRLNANVGYLRGDFSAIQYGPVIVLGPGGLFPADAIYPARVDQTFTAGLAVTYRPRLWLSVSLAYNFEIFNSDGVYYYRGVSNDLQSTPQVYLVDYTNNRVTLQFSIGF